MNVPSYYIQFPKVFYSIPNEFELQLYGYIQANEEFAQIYNNMASGLEAMITKRGGKVPTNKEDTDIERIKPLGSKSSKIINFPFISNEYLFQDDKPVISSSSNSKGDEKHDTRSKYLYNSLAPLIVETYSKSIKNLDYQRLWEICFPTKEYPKDGYVLSINESIPFFCQSRLKLLVVDKFENVLLIYHPEDEGISIDKHKTPSTLRLLLHQNWVFKLDHNVESFDQKVKSVKKGITKIRSKFYIKNNFTYIEDNILLTLLEIFQFIKSYQGK